MGNLARKDNANAAESISIIVPTLQAGRHLADLLPRLRDQKVSPAEIVIMDSSSSDDTVAVACASGCVVEVIPRSAFDHGGTRNLGARKARGEILVFMTQDAIPVDEYWLQNLVFPIASGEVVATFARQIPREDAGPLERFARGFNYPAKSRVKKLADVSELGYKAFFFSNVCSAVRADAFWEVGGFPEGVILNEDVLLCAKLLRAGCRVKYEAEARVYHSHSYSLVQQFRRNFDIGASVRQAGSLLEGARTGGEGSRFVLGQVRYVLRTGNLLDLFRVFGEAVAKLTAFNLGKRERYVPCAIKRRMSMHHYFWKCS